MPGWPSVTRTEARGEHLPTVDAQQKQLVKAQATRAALFDNNAAAILATAGAATALVSPAHAAVLGVGSGLFWLCANYRQSIANDPPADDFDTVWITAAQIDEASLPGSESREQLLYRFDAEQLLVCDGLYALLRSLERYEGAVNAGSDLAADQADAAAQNAEAIAAHQDTLVSLATEVNQAWRSIHDEFGVDWNAVSLTDVQQFYRDTVGESSDSPGPAMSSLAASVTGGADDLLEPFDTGLSHPVLDATELPDEPSDLLSSDYIDGLDSLSAALRGLVTS